MPKKYSQTLGKDAFWFSNKIAIAKSGFIVFFLFIVFSKILVSLPK